MLHGQKAEEVRQDEDGLQIYTLRRYDLTIYGGNKICLM
jgi:hypothetical protein